MTDTPEKQEDTPADHRRQRRWYWAGWVLLILALIALAVVAGDKPCDPKPPPEPVPADCKPGQPCPVDGETSIGLPEKAP